MENTLTLVDGAGLSGPLVIHEVETLVFRRHVPACLRRLDEGGRA